MSTAPIVFNPDFGWPWLAVLASFAVLAIMPALLRRAPGSLIRGLGFMLLLAILAGPNRVAETRRPLPDIALLLVDHSQSMGLGNRTALAAAAASALRAGTGAVQVQTIEIAAATDGGTALFAALHAAMATIPPGQLAGIVAITDGEIADAPATLPPDPPFTTLLTAKAEETDRELRLIGSPGYGLVGQSVKLQLEVLDHGADDPGTAVPITITEDGTKLLRRTIAVGTPIAIDLPVRHAGPNIVQAAAAPLPGEASTVNDQAVFTINGIQRRLNVLLISGSPDLGERSWRLLLKSDPATQLVHFTILRNPGETIDADPADLALVPFPVHELFVTDIDKFDLIILDRFNSTGLLPDEDLADIASYVQSGGALLAELGPEFSGPQSLAYSPLGPVLPAQPADPGTITAAFAPTVTALGARHPVTAPFAAAPLADWFRMQAATPSFGDVLMTGANNAPLLILGTAAKGRVGMLLSDQFWLWTRGGRFAGPAMPLLGRIVHWLLREPGLDPESLAVQLQDGQFLIRRQTLGPDNPGAIAATAPDGTTTRIALHRTAPGLYTATATATQHGVWQFAQGDLTAYAANPLQNVAEYADLAATAAILGPLSRNVVWLGQTPAPPLSQLIRPRHASAVTGSSDIPLLPPFPTVLLALALLALAWWRESR